MFEGLDRFELWDVFFMARGAVGTDMAFLTSILFAYLVVAFMAAQELSQFQLVTITTIYSVIFGYTCYTLSSAIDLTLIATEALGLGNYSKVAIPFYLVMLLTWIVSIVFMLQARRSK